MGKSFWLSRALLVLKEKCHFAPFAGAQPRCSVFSFTIEFARYGSETEVFPRSEMIAATEEVLNDNGVRSQGSPDSLAIWNAKPGP